MTLCQTSSFRPRFIKGPNMEFPRAFCIDEITDASARFIVIPNGVNPPQLQGASELQAYVADIFRHFPRIMGDTGVLILPRMWANFMQWFLHRETVHCLGAYTGLYV